MISLELWDISKSFGERNVFSNINVSVNSGCLVITGPNGSGKSTLLRVITGLISPSSGEVVIRDGETPVSQESRRDMMGLVAPDLALYEELSALENLQFFAKVRGLKISGVALRELLSEMGLGGREDDPLRAYSSGMRQRVKYAFAVMHNPPVLLLDEPSANFDEAGKEVMDSVISKQKRDGIVVIATNDQSELAYGDQLLELGV